MTVVTSRRALWQRSRGQGFQRRSFLGQVGDRQPHFPWCLRAPESVDVSAASTWSTDTAPREGMHLHLCGDAHACTSTFTNAESHGSSAGHECILPERLLLCPRHPCKDDSSDSCFTEAQNARTFHVVDFSSVVAWRQLNDNVMSCPVEDKHETSTRLMLVGIALKNKDQLKTVIRSVKEHPSRRSRCWLVEGRGLLRGE